MSGRLNSGIAPFHVYRRNRPLGAMRHVALRENCCTDLKPRLMRFPIGRSQAAVPQIALLAPPPYLCL